MAPRKKTVIASAPADTGPAQATGDFNGADETKFDHDGDGHPGGSLPDAKPEIAPAPEPELELVSDASNEDDELAEPDADNAAVDAADLPEDEPEPQPAPAPPRAPPNIVVTADSPASPGSAAAIGEITRKGAPPPPPRTGAQAEMCTVRITKAGHGQVHTGRSRPNKQTYDWQDEVALPRTVGLQLEGRNFGEILD